MPIASCFAGFAAAQEKLTRQVYVAPHDGADGRGGKGIYVYDFDADGGGSPVMSSKFFEVHWRGGGVEFVGHQMGIGYVGAEQPVAGTSRQLPNANDFLAAANEISAIGADGETHDAVVLSWEGR